jgi:hypothetical protein
MHTFERAAPRAPRIVFVVMSAVARAATVDQLARALSPHLVLVHHDFSQTRHFHLSAPNVRFVPDPRRTGWAVFGFADGVFHSMKYALGNVEFDYLQTLSPSCLPIKPLRQFEAHASGDAQAHFDCIDLLADRDALMSVGYRAFTPEDSLRHRVLRRLSVDYFGPSPGRRDECGVWLRSGRGPGMVPRVAELAVNAASRAWLGRHVFASGLRPYYGSSWFGARREVVQGMVDLYERPGVRDAFSRIRIADEFLMPTLLMQLKPRKGPMNHFVQEYDEAHPRLIRVDDLPRLRNSPAYFARKFEDDPTAPVRLRALRELAGIATLGDAAHEAQFESWPVRRAAP